MRRSQQKILTTHVGALPAPMDVWSDLGADLLRLRREVANVIQFQRAAGVDIINEGELTKGGNWVTFLNDRLSGFESDIVDVMLSVKAQTYLFEAGNVRHEHEYTVWDTVRLPEGKIIAPGVVSHATTLIEHPDLVSERIQRFARRVGAENVIASTDCGLGLRCHPQIAWAKLNALAEGARRASRSLGMN